MAGVPHVIHVDLVNIYESPDRKDFLHTLAWGDFVDVIETHDDYLCIATAKYEKQQDGSILPSIIKAYICPPKSSGLKPSDCVIPKSDNRVLKVNFVDVQQGDAAVIESPDGKIMLVDGGDNQLFARYLATRYRGSSEVQPQKIDCILVTHGDADHFSGLSEIYKSEKNKNPLKRLFIAPQRVYHNGLVKRPTEDSSGKNIPEKDLLGVSEVVDGERLLTDLVDDLLAVDDSKMNRPFLAWKKALSVWNQRQPIEFRRLALGDDNAFDFFTNAGIEVKVLGPILTRKAGKTGLKFLGKPPSRIGQASGQVTGSGALSASHTINGHSVVFRLRYGGFNYLFTGDLNDEAGRALVEKHRIGEINLRSEVFKVPHHGSADFSTEFLQEVAPLASIVSSGDESAKKEYMHPRATLVGALGRFSRIDEPLVFVTELVAFFSKEGWSKLSDPDKKDKRGEFFAFSRAAYGIVKTRTDGQRLLVYTDSGRVDMKEAYCFSLDAHGNPVPSAVVRV